MSQESRYSLFKVLLAIGLGLVALMPLLFVLNFQEKTVMLLGDKYNVAFAGACIWLIVVGVYVAFEIPKLFSKKR